jgi:hypothetical protein
MGLPSLSGIDRRHYGTALAPGFLTGSKAGLPAAAQTRFVPDPDRGTMHGEHHHDLAQEFPGLKQRIHELKLTSPEFNQLYAEYRELDKAIYRIEEEIETPSDSYTEDLKKKRVRLKDKLYAMLAAVRP